MRKSVCNFFRPIQEEAPKPKKSREKTPPEVAREKSSSVVSDAFDNDAQDEPDELGSLSSKLLDKLAEEESKLKKINNLEIGTWSNEMAENVQNVADDVEEVRWNFNPCLLYQIKLKLYLRYFFPFRCSERLRFCLPTHTNFSSNAHLR